MTAGILSAGAEAVTGRIRLRRTASGPGPAPVRANAVMEMSPVSEWSGSGLRDQAQGGGADLLGGHGFDEPG
jgi:hypothetical protein